MTHIIGFFIAMLILLFLDWKAAKRFHHSILIFCGLVASMFGFLSSIAIYVIARIFDLQIY